MTETKKPAGITKRRIGDLRNGDAISPGWRRWVSERGRRADERQMIHPGLDATDERRRAASGGEVPGPALAQAGERADGKKERPQSFPGDIFPGLLRQ